MLCMQETKLADDAFPALTFEAMGYECAHYGQGQWNGVAILSKVGLDDVVANFAGDIEPDPDARILTATCGGVRISCCYVPNGRSLDDDHYTYKLSWLDRLLAHLEHESDPGDDVPSSPATSTSPRPTPTSTTSASSRTPPTSALPNATGSRRSAAGDWSICSGISTSTPTRCTRGGTTGAATSTRAASPHRPGAR
ncbi:MAG: hypothetical protein R2697_11405 [Ilumatobacteraceae bacterium]